MGIHEAAAPAKGEKITIYMTGVAGAITKREGFLKSADRNGITYFPPKARKHAAMVMSYYAPFWMIVKGWGHPAPDSLFLPPEAGDTPGVTTQKGRYRSSDPRWVEDFFSGPGKHLKPWAMLRNGSFEKASDFPETPASESLRAHLDDLGLLIDAADETGVLKLQKGTRKMKWKIKKMASC